MEVSSTESRAFSALRPLPGDAGSGWLDDCPRPGERHSKGEKEVLHVADTLNQKLLDKEEALTKQLEETGLDEATKEA